MFDIVISNAMIIDGYSPSPYFGHIGIKGDRILKIETSAPIRGKRIIDAKGKVISPGFVDIHSHSDYFLLVNPNAESKVRQGVTTEVGGNCGYSAAPIFGEEAHERKVEYRKHFSLDLNWNTVQGYNRLLEDVGISINFALLIGHNTVRSSVMGKNDREPSDTELGGCVWPFNRSYLPPGVFLQKGGDGCPKPCDQEIRRCIYNSYTK